MNYRYVCSSMGCNFIGRYDSMDALPDRCPQCNWKHDQADSRWLNQPRNKQPKKRAMTVVRRGAE